MEAFQQKMEGVEHWLALHFEQWGSFVARHPCFTILAFFALGAGLTACSILIEMDLDTTIYVPTVSQPFVCTLTPE